MHRTLTLLRSRTGLATAYQLPVWELVVTRGKDKKARRRVEGTRATIGTCDAAELRLTDTTVSSLHCELLLDEQGFRVRDLGSKNGVRLEGRRVFEAQLADGDSLELGQTVVRLKLLEEERAQPLTERTHFGPLRGSSWRMRACYDELAKAAQSDAPVLLEGETGTGKELAAEALLEAGPRAKGPFVVVDCSSLSSSMVEDELFGHEKGAFTGASTARAGRFESADGGTLLLDSVGELPLELQPRLLGVLDRQSFTRLGGTHPKRVDVRVIASTQRPLEEAVNKGQFRADLFYRLAALHIRIPALRERREDIPELISLFLEALPKRPTLPPAVVERLLKRDYRGNVRELRNLVERLAMGLDEPSPELPPEPFEPNLEVPFRVQKERLLASFERAYLKRLLESCGGNVSEAARKSGINRAYLYERLERLALRS